MKVVRLCDTCMMPRPSQRPAVPPIEVRKVKKLNWGNPYIFLLTVVEKINSIRDIFLRSNAFSLMKTIFIFVSVHGRRHPEFCLNLKIKVTLLYYTWILSPIKQLLKWMHMCSIRNPIFCYFRNIFSCPKWHKAFKVVQKEILNKFFVTIIIGCIHVFMAMTVWILFNKYVLLKFSCIIPALEINH